MPAAVGVKVCMAQPANGRCSLPPSKSANPSLIVRRTSNGESLPKCKALQSSVIPQHLAHKALELLDKQQFENSNSQRTPLLSHRPVHTTADLCGKHQHDTITLSPQLHHRAVHPAPDVFGNPNFHTSPTGVHRHPDWQGQMERHQSDCRCLIDNIRNDFERRFSSLEALLLARVAALETNLETKVQVLEDDHPKRPTWDPHLPSEARNLDSLSSRVSNLEARTQISAQTLEGFKSTASNLKTQIESAVRIVEQINSQMTSTFSALEPSSQAYAEIQTKVSVEGNALALAGMQLRKSDLPHAVSNVEHLTGVAPENRRIVQTIKAINHARQHQPVVEDLETETELTAKEPPLTLREQMCPQLEQPLPDARAAVKHIHEVQVTSSHKAAQSEAQPRAHHTLEGGCKHGDTLVVNGRNKHIFRMRSL